MVFVTDTQSCHRSSAAGGQWLGLGGWIWAFGHCLNTQGAGTEGCTGYLELLGPFITSSSDLQDDNLFFPSHAPWHGLKSAQSSPANASSSSDSSSDSDFEPSQNHSQGGSEGELELVEGVEVGGTRVEAGQ